MSFPIYTEDGQVVLELAERPDPSDVLRQTADAIESDPDSWSQANWWSVEMMSPTRFVVPDSFQDMIVSMRDHACDTQFCSAGHAVKTLDPKQIISYNDIDGKGDPIKYMDVVAGALMGIDEAVQDILFDAEFPKLYVLHGVFFIDGASSEGLLEFFDPLMPDNVLDYYSKSGFTVELLRQLASFHEARKPTWVSKRDLACCLECIYVNTMTEGDTVVSDKEE